jgi:hypothetical protein
MGGGFISVNAGKSVFKPLPEQQLVTENFFCPGKDRLTGNKDIHFVKTPILIICEK